MIAEPNSGSGVEMLPEDKSAGVIREQRRCRRTPEGFVTLRQEFATTEFPRDVRDAWRIMNFVACLHCSLCFTAIIMLILSAATTTLLLEIVHETRLSRYRPSCSPWHQSHEQHWQRRNAPVKLMSFILQKPRCQEATTCRTSKSMSSSASGPNSSALMAERHQVHVGSTICCQCGAPSRAAFYAQLEPKPREAMVTAHCAWPSTKRNPQDSLVTLRSESDFAAVSYPFVAALTFSEGQAGETDHGAQIFISRPRSAQRSHSRIGACKSPTGPIYLSRGIPLSRIGRSDSSEK